MHTSALPTSRQRIRRYAAALATAAAFAGAGAGQAAGTPTPETIYNGILSITPACQGVIDDIIIACTEFESLTREYPVMLDLNPFGTHIVVLGAGLFDDGTIRPVLEQRLRTALATAQRYPTAPIVVTGGVPRNGITEAAAMRAWLTQHGVPAGRIIEEPSSRSTVENARFTNDVLLARGATGAVLVTDRDHLRRAMINFRQSVDARIPIAGIVAN